MRADATPMSGRSSRSQVDADAIAAKFRGLKKKTSRGKKKEKVITSGGSKYSNMAANRKSIHPPTQEKAQNEFTDAKIDVGMRRAKRKSDVIKNLNRQFNKEENIQEDDMKGMSVKSGHKRPTEKGAGMTAKGVAAYRRRNPGSKLKTAVTGKVKKGSKAAKRRKSYCARSAGQMKKFPKAAKDPNSRLRQARRRWKC